MIYFKFPFGSDGRWNEFSDLQALGLGMNRACVYQARFVSLQKSDATRGDKSGLHPLGLNCIHCPRPGAGSWKARYLSVTRWRPL